MKMKKLIKGFTLIEMIVVMAILGILMAALMNFYRPVRQTFVDSTMIEDMRTTQNGILTYLTESVRYAENLIIYDDGARVTNSSGTVKTIDSPKAAYEMFIDQNSISSDNSKERVQVIVINRSDGYDNTGHHVGSRKAGYGGRLVTNILRVRENPTDPLKITAKDFPTAGGMLSSDTFMVLGGGYYGNSDYAIFIDKSKTWPNGTYGSSDETINITNGGITFAVQTAMSDETGVVKQGTDYGENTVMQVNGGMVYLTTTRAANTMNSSAPKYYIKGGSADMDLSQAAVNQVSTNNPAGSLSPTGTNITNPTSNTYIVVLEPAENR